MRMFHRAVNAVSILIAAGLVVISAATSLRADFVPFNGSEVAPNIAIIRVSDRGVTVELEVFVGDMPVFADLLPIEWLPEDAQVAANGVDRLRRFANRGLSVRTAEGTRLPVQVTLIEPRQRIDRASPFAGQRDPLSGQVVPAPPEDPRVIYAELFYSFGELRPDKISISPPMKSGIPAAVIGTLIYDRDVPVTDFRFLSGPADLNVNWSDPWYSQFAQKNLNRRAQSVASSFLYIEPRELRHETLIRLRELAPWLGVEAPEGAVISPDEIDNLTTLAAAYLQKRNPVDIDGVSVNPKTATADILSFEPRGFQIAEANAPVPVNNAFVGVILSFPVSDIPDTATVHWDMFDEHITAVSTTSTDAASPFFGEVTPQTPIFQWRNHLLTYERPEVTSIPVAPEPVWISILFWLGLGLVGSGVVMAILRRQAFLRIGIGLALLGAICASVFSSRIGGLPWSAGRLPSQTEASAVFLSAIENLNIAALEVTPESRKRELGPVVTREAISPVANELERGLAIRVPGGSLARVTKIEEFKLEKVSELTDERGFSVLASWSVLAEAGHWGHAHTRYVTYRALADMVPQDGSWKLGGITVIEARTPDV